MALSVTGVAVLSVLETDIAFGRPGARDMRNLRSLFQRLAKCTSVIASGLVGSHGLSLLQHSCFDVEVDGQEFH